MSTDHENIEVVAAEVQLVAEMSAAVLDRTSLDRTAEEIGLHTALVAILGSAAVQGHCVAAALRTPLPQGIAANVRSLLEGLVIGRYLADRSVDESERTRRLDRFFRGARKEQVRFRSALNAYPTLRKAVQLDIVLAEREEREFHATESALPKPERLGKHWSGLPKGLCSMAEAVGLGADYAFQYRVNSGVLHGARPWDFVDLEPSGTLVVPSYRRYAALGFQLGSDCLRYLAWSLDIARASRAVSLYRSEQALLDRHRSLYQPLDALIDQGIVG